MSKVTLIRTADDFPAESILEHVRRFLFGLFDGWNASDKRGWRKIWKRLAELEPGEFAVIEFVIPRSSPFHRRHFAILSAVFDQQERFEDFDMFRAWTSIGAGWVVWAAGPSGGVVPITKSISYAKADQSEFEEYHRKVIDFLRGQHAPLFLWKKMGNDAHWRMDSLLQEFGE